MQFIDAFVALFVLAIAGWVFSCWRRKVPKVSEPSCGKCQYPVRQLPTSVCPECGSNLDEVGILYPERKSALGLFYELACVAVVLGLGLVFVMNMVPLPRLIEWHQLIVLRPTDKSAAHRFEVFSRQAEWHVAASTELIPIPVTSPSIVTIRAILADGSCETVKADIDGHAYEISSRDGRRARWSSPFETEPALEWLQSMSLGGESLAEQAEILAKAAALRGEIEPAQYYLGERLRMQGFHVALVPSLATAGEANLSDPWLWRIGFASAALIWLVYARKAIRRVGPCRPCAA